jgi:hypothetical protein
MNPSFELSITKVDTRDAHGGAVVAGFEQSYHGSGAVAVGFGKNHCGSIFFEDIEKLHEFDRILVFKNETP